MSATRTTVDYAEQMAERRRAALEAASMSPDQTQAPSALASEALPKTSTDAPIGVKADTPIALGSALVVPDPPATAASAQPTIGEKKQKIKRQGIDLREVDQERIYEFDVFCMRNRFKTPGKKTGLTLYARAGFELLDRMMKDDPENAKALLRTVAEQKW